MRQTMRRNTAFTLLELMIAIALMLVVMLMLRTMFVSAQELYVTASRRVDVYSQARNALDLIEQDMMRMRVTQAEDILGLRSLRPSDFSQHVSTRTGPFYSEMSDWEGAQPNESTKIQEMIAFTGAATWYDNVENRYITGDATILYYLRRRIPISGQAPEGAYLVRRVLPVYSLAEIAAIGKGAKPSYELRPSEEELAGFVYSARIFAEDQAAFQWGMLKGRFALDTMPECTPDYSPNSSWTWVRVSATGGGQVAPPTPPVPGAVLKFLPEPPREKRVEYGGIWRTNTAPDRDFVSSRWNYPAAVMVELCIIDRSMERFTPRQGVGTYRSFSRAIQLPVSEPMNRLDDRDQLLIGQALGGS